MGLSLVATLRPADDELADNNDDENAPPEQRATANKYCSTSALWRYYTATGYRGGSLRNSNKLVVIALLLLLAAGGAYWYLQVLPEDAAPLVPALETAPERMESASPRYPIPTMPRRSAELPDLVELPPLDDSDGYFALALVDLFGREVRDLLVESALIEKFVATVDNLTRSHVADRIRPLRSIPGPFLADAHGDNETYTLNDDNHARYELFVGLLTAADTDRIVETYRRFYPLLQQAYVSLGYPDGYFNDRVVEVIDHLLATPQPEEPSLLIRPHVLYQYADADLEALSSGQKLLIRTGSKNTASIKQFLGELRARIAIGN